MRRKILGILVCMLLVGTVLPVSGTIDSELDVSETNDEQPGYYRFAWIRGEYDTFYNRRGLFQNIGIRIEDTINKTIHFQGYSMITHQFYTLNNVYDVYAPYFIGYCRNGKVNGFCFSFGNRAIVIETL